MSERTLLFIPMYNCGDQIGRVIAQLTPEVQAFLDEIVIIDNRSTDDGRAVAVNALNLVNVRARLLMNDANIGLGGSHKVAFNYALQNGFDYLIVLHGDDQGSIADLIPHLRNGTHREFDALLGARFMKGSRLQGYSAMRTLGNHVFNIVYSLASGAAIKDLGSGLNLYRVKALADGWWLGNANDLTFNYHMILRSIAAGWRMRFFPLSWRDDDQVSNVKLFRQALDVVRLPLSYAFTRRRYLESDYSTGKSDYPSTIVFENGS